MRTKINPELAASRRALGTLEAERQWREGRVVVASKRVESAGELYERHRNDALGPRVRARVQEAERELVARRSELDEHDVAIVAARFRVTELERDAEHSGPAPTFLDDVAANVRQRAELDRERNDLVAAIARLEAIVAGAPEVAVRAVMGLAGAADEQAECDRAAKRLPEARKHLAAVEGATWHTRCQRRSRGNCAKGG